MNYLAAKQSAQTWEVECRAASEALQTFPVSAYGLTPDDVKASPAYQSDKRRFDYAFKRLRAINAYIGKHYRAERYADARARRAALLVDSKA